MKHQKALKGRKKKKYGVLWYLPKHDTLIELNPQVGYALIIALIKWDKMFALDEWMFLGAI